MNQCVMPRPAYWTPGSSHKFQIAIPESCTAQSEKVQNLRNHIAELEAEMARVDQIADDLKFYSSGELVAGIVMDSCIAFLDMAASIFEPINPGAAKTAKGGVAAIRGTKATTDFASGKTNGAQFALELGQQGLSVASPKTMQGKAALKVTKTQVGAIKLAVDAMSGDDVGKSALDYAKNEARGTAGLIKDGLADSGMGKSAKVVEGLSILESVVDSAISYQDALDKRFDTHLENTSHARTFRMNQKMTLRNLIDKMTKRLEEATAALNACVDAASQPRMSVMG